MVLKTKGPITAIAGSPQMVYVSAHDSTGDSSPHTILGWNPANGRTISSRPLPGTSLAFAGGWIWAGGGTFHKPASGASYVWRLDPKTLKVSGRIATPSPPMALAPSSDGKLWVTTKGEVLEIDPSSARVVGAVPVTGNAQAISVDPSGKHVYVATDSLVTNDQDLLVEIDASSRKIVARTGVGIHELLGPSSLAATDQGVWVTYATGMQGTTVFIPEGFSGKRISIPHSQTNSASGSLSGSSLWIVDAMAGWIACFDATTGRKLATVQPSEGLQFDGEVAGTPLGKFVSAYDKLVRIDGPPVACG